MRARQWETAVIMEGHSHQVHHLVVTANRFVSCGIDDHIIVWDLVDSKWKTTSVRVGGSVGHVCLDVEAVCG